MHEKIKKTKTKRDTWRKGEKERGGRSTAACTGGRSDFVPVCPQIRVISRLIVISHLQGCVVIFLMRGPTGT